MTIRLSAPDCGDCLRGNRDTEVREAASGQAGARALFKEDRPALVILDLNLPGLGGIEVIGRLKTADTDRPCSGPEHARRRHPRDARFAGGCGRVHQQDRAAGTRFSGRSGGLPRGDSCIEHEIAQRLVFSNIRALSHALDHLSSRDLEILRLLARGLQPIVKSRIRSASATRPRRTIALRSKPSLERRVPPT